MQKSFLIWSLVFSLCGAAPAQTVEEGFPRAEALDATLETWRAQHGESWRARVDSRTGYLEMLYGGSALPAFAPNTNVEEDWFTLARQFLAATEPMHGIAGAELTDDRFVYLPLGMANSTDKITVRLGQRLLGLPVEGGSVNALFDTQGRLLSLHSTAAPRTEGLTAVPTFGGRAAVRAAIDAFEADADVPAADVGLPMLLFAQVDLGVGREARLAYQVSVSNLDVPVATLYTIDARDGSILRRDDEIHYFDVTGTIKSNATPGSSADHPGNPPVEMPMSYINVSSSAGTVQTDRDGNFVFPGVNTPLDITVQYNGTFNNVNNQAGSDYSITFSGVQPNQANTLVMNPNPGEFRTAQANTFQHVNVLRDFIRDTVPTDNTADFKATSNPNINSSCNAYFDGGSVNYYRDAGSCNNTGFSAIVAHEMGHWLNVRYGTGNGSDGMGEGNADVFAMYTYDDHIVGRYFFNSGGGIRSGLNTRQFCGDNNGGCHGGVHANGEVWMGAAWKVRRNLKNTLGTALGGATADQLFVGWMNAYNQTQIKSIIETQWLTLDDDNGDLSDGTPNFSDIDDGFREQGFPGVDIEYFQFANVTDLPDVGSDQGPYAVAADITAVVNDPVTGAELFWRVDGGAWTSSAMTPGGGSTWSGAIASIGGTGIVQYYLTATDSNGKTGAYPANGEEAPLLFSVGNVQTLAAWDFEAAGDQGWVVGHPNDDATDGIWERGDPNGTDAQSEDDHTPAGTQCWFTGQGSVGGNNSEADVDGGKTTLLSPVIDMSGLTSVQVRYWRWFSNEKGNNPSEDNMLVRVSFNGGASWTKAEAIGPVGIQSNGGWYEGGFVVDAFGTPNSTVQFRFVASDEDGSSLVEGAIDDVSITYIDGTGGCGNPTNYCVGAPNSVGPGAAIAASGSQDVNDNNFSLAATGCPANKFGFFFYGPNQTQVPAGDGFVCISGQLFRFPVDKTDALGVATRLVDFNNTPNGGDIFNGSTWNFQFGYRDTAGGPAGFNFSDAVQVPFCD